MSDRGVTIVSMEDHRALAQLAYEASLRTLDHQAGVLDELRARTGTLLTAAALVASFFGSVALRTAGLDLLTGAALAAFLVSLVACVLVLFPRRAFVFAVSGSKLYEVLYEFDDASGERERRLAFWLDAYWEENQTEIDRLLGHFKLAVLALVTETILWAFALGGTLA